MFTIPVNFAGLGSSPVRAGGLRGRQATQARLQSPASSSPLPTTVVQCRIEADSDAIIAT